MKSTIENINRKNEKSFHFDVTDLKVFVLVITLKNSFEKRLILFKPHKPEQ